MRWKQCDAALYKEVPSPRVGHTAVLVDAREAWGEDLVVIYGGLNGEKQTLEGLLVLQTASEMWLHPKAANDGPPPRAFHCAAAIGSRMFVFGGHVFRKDRQGVHKYNDLWCLNVDNWEWSQIEVVSERPQPGPRDFLAMAQLPDSKLLIFGGLDPSDKRLDDTWIFDTSSRGWEELELPLPKPKARYAHALAQVDKRVLLVGGGAENATTVLNDLWILKGAVGSEDAEPCWVPLEVPGSPPSARKAHAAAAAGWQVVVFGGHAAELGWFRSKTDHYFNDVTVLDRQGTVQWKTPSPEGESPPAREFHTLTAISATRMLLFGGGNGKAIFSDAWWLCLDDSAPQPASQPVASLGDAQEASKAHLLIEATGGTPSAMSEISAGLDTSFTPAGDVGATQGGRDGDFGADSLAKRRDGAAGRPWWAGSRDAADLRELLQRIQGPSNTSEKDWSSERRSFERLCDDISPGTAGRERTEAEARKHLLSSPTSALSMRDVEALLWDYRQSCCCCSGTGAASAEPHSLAFLAASVDRLSQDGSRRFCHMQAADLRLSEIDALHTAYRGSLLPSMAMPAPKPESLL